MTGFDSLIASTVSVTIRENLGDKTLQKIEKRIFERHGMNLTQAIVDFPKLDGVLREFFGAGAEGLEKEFMKGIVALEESARQEKEWITIQDHRLATTVLKALGDEEKNRILNSVMNESMTIPDILSTCQISEASGYEKIDSLIKDGLLVTEGNEALHDGKTETQYKTLFEDLHVDIIQNKVILKIQVPERLLENSSLIQMAFCR